MEFYTSFSEKYDQIFPLNVKKLKLIDQTFESLKAEKEDIRLLDVGCGTGSYAIALAEMGYEVVGIDLDPEMISLAKEKENKDLDVEFEEMGMLDLEDDFSSARFDGIYIIGNVLVHLSKEEIGEFLESTAELLKENGRLFIQIVNYERILEFSIDGLPTIYSEDGSLRFERDYEYDKQQNLICFKTKLISELESKILQENEIPLYPLRRDELNELLEESGFEQKECYGNPKGDPFHPVESVPLIMTAELNS